MSEGVRGRETEKDTHRHTLTQVTQTHRRTDTHAPDMITRQTQRCKALPAQKRLVANVSRHTQQRLLAVEYLRGLAQTRTEVNTDRHRQKEAKTGNRDQSGRAREKPQESERAT